MTVHYHVFSRQGPREDNQDRILVPTRVGDGYLMAIADGVGGRPGGGRAAELATTSILELFRFSNNFSTVFREIQSLISAEANKKVENKDMATTLTAAFINGGEIVVAHVGDARLYQLRSGGLKTLTRDQNQAWVLKTEGLINTRQAKRHPSRHILTSVLSARKEFELSLGRADVEVADRFIFSTDGFYDKIDKKDIVRISLESTEIAVFATKLEDFVASAHPKDNFSALIAQV